MSSLRKLGFYLKDFVEGGIVRKNLKEIEEVLNNPFDISHRRSREDSLQKLIAHTYGSVPFYKEKKGLTFYELPVINKNTIKCDFESFKSDKFLKKKLYKVSTSGSTGVPFSLYQNRIKRKRNTADLLYFMNEAHYEIGNFLLELEVYREHNKTSCLRNIVQNTSQLDITKLTEFKIIKLLELLERQKGSKNILGLPSALENIVQYMKMNDLFLKNVKIQGIIAISEFLNDYTKDLIINRFNAPIYSRYSNEEMGILAQQTAHSDSNFMLNWSSYFFEILDMNEDRPIERGEVGRIVVTDLFNYSMPLIRYDTGDIGSFSTDFPDNRYLASLEGRKMDLVYDTEGNMVSPHVVHEIFYPYMDLLHQFQFIQKGTKEYCLKLNPIGQFKLELDLVQSVKEDFGNDANVTFKYVDGIPPLSSGKQKKVLNLYKLN